jgi:Cof subfamily protein (haloacid dehalogenase superfamily)
VRIVAEGIVDGVRRGGALTPDWPPTRFDLGRIKLVATDMDGTLLDPTGEVSLRTTAAVAGAREAGIHVIPVTGRPPQALWQLAAEAGLGPLGVCANGAAIVDLEHQTVIELDEIPGEAAVALVALVRAAVPGVRMAADLLDRFSYEVGFFESPVDWQEKMEEVADILSVVTQGCTKLVARTSATPAPILIDRLEEVVGGIGHVTSSGLDWVDIGPPGITKAQSVRRVCKLLGVSESDVVAIGDNHNDLSLLAWAALSMAPANAIPEAIALAHHVLPANADHGVAALLEELVVTRPPG